MKRIGALSKRLIDLPYIYRIELLDRFYSILDQKEIVFVNPDKWEDPLENLIFNAKVIKNGSIYKNPAKEKIFSQCWSFEGDSYGIWKIYTTKPDDQGIVKRHMGVRITTKLDNLNHLSEVNKGTYYYGLVDYLWKYQLDKMPKEEKIKKALKITKPSKEHLETLLIKRKSYAYEKEVRLFAIPDQSLVDNRLNFLCRLKLEPKEFITSLRFDPGMEYEEFKQHKERLIDEYGFKPTQVTQSSYFRKNNYVINLDE